MLYDVAVATLGEAFVEVKADLRPFTRDLQRELLVVVKAFESTLNKQLGERLGTNLGAGIRSKIGDGVAQGIDEGGKRGAFKKKDNLFVSFTAAIGAALDDGLSALPTEVKAAIVLGIAAVSPFVVSGLGSAVAAGVGVGFTFLGTLLASQFTQVQNSASDTFSNIRETLVNTSRVFASTMIEAFEILDTRVSEIAPMLERILNMSAKFIVPLLEGLLNGIDFFLQGIEEGFSDVGPLIFELKQGIELIGTAIGEAFRIVVQSGDDGQEALRDLLLFVSSLIVAVGLLVRAFIEVYGVIKDIAELFAPLLTLSSQYAGVAAAVAAENAQVAASADLVVEATKKEEKQLKETIATWEGYRKAVNDAYNEVISILEANIEFERSLDELDEALQENGKNLDIRNEKGREVNEAFIRSIKAATEATAQQVAQQQLSTGQAVSLFNQQIAAIREQAHQAGITRAEFDRLFGAIVQAGQARIEIDAGVFKEITSDANASTEAILKLIRALARLRDRPQGPGGPQEFADGGIVATRTSAIVGEAGPEVIIPLTRPARAAQLARDSGLTQILGNTGSTMVNVFIGNERLEQVAYRVVEANNFRQSQALAYGPR